MAPIKTKRQKRRARQKIRAANGTEAKDRKKTKPTTGGRPPTPSMIRKANNEATREAMRARRLGLDRTAEEIERLGGLR